MQCLGKTAHASRKAAEMALMLPLERGHIKRRAGRFKIMAYQCSECGYWHIGGSDPERATHLAYSVDLICAGCERPFRRMVMAGQQMPEFCTVCRRAIRSELRSAAL